MSVPENSISTEIPSEVSVVKSSAIGITFIELTVNITDSESK